MTVRLAAAKEDSDGPFCRLFQRRLSRRITPHAAARMSPNAVTGAGFAVGMAGAACAAAGAPLGAAVLLQAFGVLSCVDGEVARARRATSQLGDFLDTMTDRAVEVAAISGSVALLARSGGLRDEALAAGFATLGGVLLLVVSSEKYRSSYGHGYPKRRYERGLAWVSAGSDARLLVLSVGLLAASAGAPRGLLGVLVALASLAWINAAWRIAAVARHAGEATG